MSGAIQTRELAAKNEPFPSHPEVKYGDRSANSSDWEDASTRTLAISWPPDLLHSVNLCRSMKNTSDHGLVKHDFPRLASRCAMAFADDAFCVTRNVKGHWLDSSIIPKIERGPYTSYERACVGYILALTGVFPLPDTPSPFGCVAADQQLAPTLKSAQSTIAPQLVSQYIAGAVTEEKRVSFVKTPTLDKEVVTVVKRDVAKTMLPVGASIPWPELVTTAFSDIDSGQNMGPNVDYVTIARMAACAVGDGDFDVSYDLSKNMGMLTTKFRMKNKTMAHPDSFEASRHLGWRYLREVRKLTQGQAIRPEPGDRPTEPARILRTIYNDTRTIGSWCWGSTATVGYQSMLIMLDTSGVGRGSGIPAGSPGGFTDYAFVGDAFTGGFSQVEGYTAYLTNLAWRKGGIVRAHLHAIVMHAAGQSQSNIQFAMGRVTTDGNTAAPFTLRAYAVTPVSYNAAYPAAPTTNTPTQRNSVRCSLVFPPLSDGRTDAESEGLVIGYSMSQNETTMTWPVGTPEREWPYQYTGPTRPQLDFHLTVTVEYIPPDTPLSLSGDVELNPGPMMVVLTDGAISDIMSSDQTRELLERALLRKTPLSVWKGLTVPGLSGPDIVSWSPDDGVKTRAVERKVHPTGNKRPDGLVGQRESKLADARQAARKPDPELDDFSPGWAPGSNSGKPIGICDVTPATQIKSVLQRVAEQIRSDDDYVLWLMRRRPTISWANLVGGYCKLGSVGQLAMELYRGKFPYSLWPSVYSLRANDYGGTFASILFDSFKSERSLPESLATLIDLLSNAERLENPLLDTRKLKNQLCAMSKRWLSETPLSDGQIEIPSVIRLVCVELNPGPVGTIMGFPAGRHPTVSWLAPEPLLLGGSDGKYVCTPSDVPSLMTLKPVGSESWSAKDVAAQYVSVELPNRGTDNWTGDGFMVRTVTTAGVVQNANALPREAFALYRSQSVDVIDSKQGPTFSAVGTLPNKQSSTRWSKSSTADDFLLKLLGPVAGRADRAIWFGFRYSDVGLWLNTIMTQQEAKYTISATSIPSSSYYLNYLRVALALVPKVIADVRFPSMGAEYGVVAANTTSFQYSLSYNNGLAAYGENLALGSPAFTSGNNRFSLWVSADQASDGAGSTNLLPVPSQLISAATSDDMANKFLALFIRMWAAAPNELAFLSRPGAGANIRKFMCTASMVAVQGGIDDIRLIMPIRQAAGLPADAVEAREQSMMIVTTPAGVGYNYSVAAPTWINMAGYLTEWLATTTAEEVLLFMNVMATLTASLKDMNAALHDAFAMSARYTQGFVADLPTADQQLTNAIAANWASYSGVDQPVDNTYYPANPDAVEVAFWGHQTPISTFALQLFGLISDNERDASTLKGFNTVSEIARHARYPARACAVANHAFIYCADISPSIFDNCDSDSGLSQYLTFMYNTHCSGDGRVVWPVRERLYGAVWGTSPPKDKLGLSMCSRVALNFLLEAVAPAITGVGAYADNYNCVILPDSHLGPLRCLGPLFEHFKPSTDIMNTKLIKEQDAITVTQNVWIDVVNTNVRRLVAPIRPDNAATFLLGDEFSHFSQYEKQVFRLASASEMASGAPIGTTYCFTAADQTDLPSYTVLPHDITPRFVANSPTSAALTWNAVAVSRSTFCVPKVVRSTSASPQLVRVYLTFLSPQTEIGTMTGARPYGVLTLVDYGTNIGNMLNLKSGGVKLSDMKMDSADSADALKVSSKDGLAAPAAAPTNV